MTATLAFDYASVMEAPVPNVTSSAMVRKPSSNRGAAVKSRRHNRSMSSASLTGRRAARPDSIRLPNQSCYLDSSPLVTPALSTGMSQTQSAYDLSRTASSPSFGSVDGYFGPMHSTSGLPHKSSLATPPLPSSYSGYEQPTFSKTKAARTDRLGRGDKCFNVSLVVRDGVAEVRSENVELDIDALAIRSTPNSATIRQEARFYQRSPVLGTFLPSPSVGRFDDLAAASIGGLNRTISSAGSDASISRGVGALTFVHNSRGQAMIRSMSHQSRLHNVALPNFPRPAERRFTTEAPRPYRRDSLASKSTNGSSSASRTLASACNQRSTPPLCSLPSSSDTGGQSPQSVDPDHDAHSSTTDVLCFSEEDFPMQRAAGLSENSRVPGDEHGVLNDSDTSSSDDDDELDLSGTRGSEEDDAQAVVRKLFDRQRLRHGSGATYLDSVSSIPQPPPHPANGLGLKEDCLLNNVPPTPLSKRSTAREHPLGCGRCGMIFRGRTALKKHETADSCGVRMPSFRASDFYDVQQDDGFPSLHADDTPFGGFGVISKSDAAIDDEDVLLGDMLF